MPIPVMNTPLQKTAISALCKLRILYLLCEWNGGFFRLITIRFIHAKQAYAEKGKCTAAKHGAEQNQGNPCQGISLKQPYDQNAETEQ